MYFMILATDVAQSSKLRAQHVDAHRARLKKLVNDGRLLLAGPLPGIASKEATHVTGSLIVAEFESLESADAWIQDDIYHKNGVYQSVLVKPFVPVLP